MRYTNFRFFSALYLEIVQCLQRRLKKWCDKHATHRRKTVAENRFKEAPMGVYEGLTQIKPGMHWVSGKNFNFLAICLFQV